MKKGKKILSLMLASVMTTSMVAGSGLVLAGCNNNSGDNTNITLTVPASINYANGKLTWAAVANATSYEVTVTVKGGTDVKLKKTVTATELDVTSLAAGEYTAAIVAIGGEGYTNSDAKTADFTVAAELQKLATPTGFAYANDKVTWTAVTGATAGYLVKVTKKDNSVAIAEKTVMAAELDVSALEAGEYTVSVTAKAVDGKNAASLPASYTLTVAEKVQTLATPTNAAVDAAARKVTWGEVANAEEYVVTIKVDGKEVEKETVTKAEYDISGLEEATFTLTVVAKAEGYQDSAEYTYNATISAVALEKVNDLAANTANTEISWKHTAGGADHYRVVIKNGTESVLDKTVSTGKDGVYSLDITDVATGNYTVEVTAVADSYDVFRKDSEPTSFALNVASLGAYAAVENIHVNGANIVWDANNALGYEIVVTEKGKTQALDIKGVKAVGESFSFLATGLPKGDYTISVTPKDNRHTGTATAATYDVALKNVKTFDAEAIAKFDGDTANGGEHGKVELLTKGEKKVAQVKPTVDGWGRVRSEAFIINYSNNPIVVIDVDEVVIGGYHLEVNIGGEKYKIIRDSMVVGGTIATFVPERENEEGKPAGITGLHESYLRLGVDHSTENALNNAETHFNSVGIWYLNEWTEPLTGNLDAVGNYEVSNGMDISWGGVENADAYRVSVTKKGATEAENVSIHEGVQPGLTYRARDLAEGEYVISVAAFNSENELLVEAPATNYTFKVAYLKEYSTQDILNFTYLDGDSRRVDYDEDRDAAIIDPEANGWGVMGPTAENAASVNLTNKPFAYVDIVAIEGTQDNAGYISRAKYTPADSESEMNIVLRNDTPTKSSDDWYIELWKNPDGNAIYGNASYRFGVGFINKASIVVKSIRIVEITEVSQLIHGAKDPLAAPSNARENKGVISADPVKGNSEYTPTYEVTVTAKGETTAVYTGTDLAAPSVNLAALGLTSGTTYTVTFKAIGDDDYFVDSAAYTVDVQYTAVTLIDDFTDADFTTYAERNGGDTTVTINDQGHIVSATPSNNNWGFNFIALDLSDIIDDIDSSFYMQLLVDGTQSTSGATIATRFTVRADDGSIASSIRDTGYGETPAGDTHLTKEWNDVISNDKTFGFAVGHGGITVADAESKTIVFTGIQFVKFTIVTDAD